MPPRSDPDELNPRRATARGEADLRMTLLAGMAAPALARARISRWLDAHGWPQEQHDDLVLAVSEAVSNSVEHGYGVNHTTGGHDGLVEVHGVVYTEPDEHRFAVLTVTDHGSWLPPSAERGNRRHGMPLMEACAESMTVDGTGHGTTVVLRSRPVPPAR